MGLGKPLGTFSLEESDEYVGSFFSEDDNKVFLHVDKFTIVDKGHGEPCRLEITQ